MTNPTGRPPHFRVDVYLDAVEDMIASDEVEKAFAMLDNMPTFYQDFPPERAREIRRSLNRQLFTPVQYISHLGHEVSEADAIAAWSHRFQALERVMQAFSDLMHTPHIMELAPGSHIVSAGLRAKGFSFTYDQLSLEPSDTRPIPEADAPTIFVAFELIEHLADPWEIYRNYLRFEREADVVMLSTPLYTHSACSREWRTAALGHLRTYSPSSLHAVVSAMFEGYTWSVETSDVIVLKGVRV